MTKYLRQLLSDKDGLADEMPLILLVVVLVYIVLWLYWVFTGHPFAPTSFAEGFAGIVTAGAGAMGLKATGQGVRSRLSGSPAPTGSSD